MNNNQTLLPEQQTLKYHPQLAHQLFEPISGLPWSMLLRSASDSHPDSRYDILVANPLTTLVTKGDESIVTEDGRHEVTREDPFALIDRYLDSKLPFTESETQLPFIGGALGYFGYDLGRRVEKIPEKAQKDIDIPDMAVGLYSWAVVVDHKLKQALVVGENVARNLKWLKSQQQDQRKASERKFSLTGEWQSNMTRDEYSAKFNRVQEYLLSGDCYQINLAQRFQAGFSGDTYSAYLQLEDANQAPFSAFIRLDDASVLSISPERFLQIDDRQIETKPIKGTRPRSENRDQDLANARDLANTEKDQAENLMIVDLLRNDIGRVAEPGSVRVPRLFDIESFPAVHHLVSTVTARLENRYSPTDCLRACFPGGSITGAPKVRAMEIIEELEPHRRSVYCGSIGYISRNGRMDTSITIRTLVTYDNQIYAWAGGGLVADSDCDSEYQETLDKLSRILPVLEPDSGQLK